jgi:bifunctional non-homologous end joining protein LigD
MLGAARTRYHANSGITLASDALCPCLEAGIAKTKSKPTEVAGMRFTSPERVVYPDVGVTKLELAEHYLLVAPLLLPHLRSRPVTMIRCPDNYHQCFFQKHIDKAAHYEGVTPVWLKEDRGRGLYASIDNPRGLIALVQLGVVEFHTPGIRADKLTHPDRFILDLDPDPTVAWPAVVEAAMALRVLLQELGLKSFVKTTGGKGLHVVTPIRRTQTIDQVREFTQEVAGIFEQASPKRYTTNVSKARRTGKILLDYLRNASGATAVEVFSARARAGAPVAVPVAWEELGESTPGFNIRNVKERLASQRADPWSDFFETRQAITAKSRRQIGL